jgi:hypothetical protein
MIEVIEVRSIVDRMQHRFCFSNVNLGPLFDVGVILIVGVLGHGHGEGHRDQTLLL